MSQPPPLRSRPPSSPWMACLFGCLALLLTMLLVAGVAAAGLYFLAKSMIDTYTETAPMELPVVEATEEEARTIEERVQDFAAGARGESSTRELMLSANDINVLLQRHPDLAKFPGRMFVEIDGRALRGRISIAFDELPLEGMQRYVPGLSGRYLNGEAALSLSVVGGELFAHFEEITVAGKSVPEQVMTELRNLNLARDAESDPEVRDVIRQLASVEIANDAVHLKLKPLEAQ